MSNKKFKILTISGGGIRGIIPATVLQEIERGLEKPISDIFDLVVGTSTGGIIATSLAAGFPAEEVARLYIEQAHNIFKRSFGYKIKSGYGLLKSKYPQDGIKKVIETYFGFEKISTSKVDFITTAYETNLNTIELFKSWKPEHSFYTFSDVALATSAAPTTFPAYEVNGHKYIDGGIYANSPVEIGWIEAIKKGYKPKDIVIVSLGTGFQPYKSYSTKDWGIKSWLMKKGDTPLLDMVFNGIKEKDHYITGLLFDNFIHLNPLINSKIKVDETDPNILKSLYQVGKNSAKSLDFQEFIAKYIND